MLEEKSKFWSKPTTILKGRPLPSSRMMDVVQLLSSLPLVSLPWLPL